MGVAGQLQLAQTDERKLQKWSQTYLKNLDELAECEAQGVARQEKKAKEEPPTPRKGGVALVRQPEELKSLCIEHNREPREYSANEDFDQGERDGKRMGRRFRGRALALQTRCGKSWSRREQTLSCTRRRGRSSGKSFTRSVGAVYW